MKATIIVPIHGPPDLLDIAIRSVLAQTHSDWELFLICDGAHPAAVEMARAFEQSDARIKAFVFPKGERHGEAYRHQVLQQASGHGVFYLCEDDFWLPEHLSEMSRLLESHDYVHSRPMVWIGETTLAIANRHLGMEGGRDHLMHNHTNVWGLSSGAHTLALYRRLPEGWSPAPKGIATDIFMWRKLLADPGVRFTCSPLLTVLQMPAENRRALPAPQMRALAENWYELISSTKARDSVRRHFETHRRVSFKSRPRD